MAVTQNLTVKVNNATTGKAYTKTFKDIAAETIADTNDANTFASDYAKIVDGTYTGGELANVEPFEAA